MFKYRYSIRVWTMIYDWLGIQSTTPSWSDLQTVKQWWAASGRRLGCPRKAANSLQILVCWEIWNERNARFFHKKEYMPTRVVGIIKEEAKTWVLAGASFLEI
ncbi:hypothetical protein CFC21_091713 [Triticum aestivum]|uniref:Uncharacterized protein n=2 Tax=Triticum aestivum TaxID=4565 RepID=A0A9R1LGX4_WHEAT|nr:hypothetical protein CFC21_091712 [Triticum aestivum]KAF7088626.1 hypothetical protein CFC21_091713 [Triticum aestivum]